MKLVKLFIEIRNFIRDWYLEEMYAKYGETDVPEGASFSDIEKYYNSLED